MLISEGQASIVKAVVQMAHSLNLKVTAEGIETEAQQRALEALGCDTGQGYKLGRPMSAQDLACAVSRTRTTSGDLAVPLPG
jgi:EAL domain-containing protein (putative c-di-GMP-specific phosphodiesterase class I)